MRSGGQVVSVVHSWLDSIPTGESGVVFADEIDDAILAFADPPFQPSAPTQVTLEWPRLPALSRELSQAASALARAVRTIHPALYTSAASRESDDRWMEADVDSAVADSTARVAGVLPTAARRIHEACREGKLPRLAGLPLADEVRQLALALDPERLVLLLVIRALEWPEAALLPLARGAEWLARNTGARVIVIMPALLSGHPSLDAIAYRSLRVPRATPRDPEPEPSGQPPSPAENQPTEGEPAVSLSPITGRPHPASEPEQVLYGKIIADPELAPLFQYNQVISTLDGHTPRVDLVWRAGGLVVEVDGHALHSRRPIFYQDRQRDYRLLAAGGASGASMISRSSPTWRWWWKSSAGWYGTLRGGRAHEEGSREPQLAQRLARLWPPGSRVRHNG